MEGLIHGGAYLRNFTVFFFVFKYRINFAGNCSIVFQRTPVFTLLLCENGDVFTLVYLLFHICLQCG